MYLQLAEKPRKSTWISAYNRKSNYVPAHKRALSEQPPQYLLNENGVYTREDAFDYLPLNDYCKMLSEQNYGLSGIKKMVQKRAERKDEKHAAKIDKTYSKNELRRDKGSAKLTRAESGGGAGKQILDNLPKILDTVGNVIGVVKGGEVVPVTPESGGGVPSGGGSASVSFWDKETALPVVGNVSNKKIVGGLAVLTVAGIAAKKFL